MLPIACANDMHVCPMLTVLVPHVGGAIPMGCPTVLVCGNPVARVGDPVACVGPPDVIATGSATVMIGGMPAAQMNSSTAHGGTVVAVCMTVMVA